jgi:hypothetical protein
MITVCQCGTTTCSNQQTCTAATNTCTNQNCPIGNQPFVPKNGIGLANCKCGSTSCYTGQACNAEQNKCSRPVCPLNSTWCSESFCTCGDSGCYNGGICTQTNGVHSCSYPGGSVGCGQVPTNKCLSGGASGDPTFMKFECKSSVTYSAKYYLDSQCTQENYLKKIGATPSSKNDFFTGNVGQWKCPNGVKDTCSANNNPSNGGSCSKSPLNNSPSPSKKDGGSSGKPIKTDYAVAHTISLQGITATQFNDDPLIIKSFRQAIAILLGIPTSDIINLVAQSQSRRVLRDMIVQHRNLEKSGCR